MVVRALSFHASYGCRSSGACCRSGWEIPVEPDAEALIRAALEDGRLSGPLDWARPASGLPHGARVALRVLPSGDCAFLEPGAPRLCAVHRQLGADALPPSCRQFPRLATLTPLGVSVTLSHYCPTAAGLLFEDDRPLGIVTDPPAFPRAWPFEGLDARDALAPLLRPGVLASWPVLARFEEHAVSLLARDDLRPEAALGVLEGAAERLRAWTVRDGPFDAYAARALESADAVDSAKVAVDARRTPAARGDSSITLDAAIDDWERVAARAPAGRPRPASPRAEILAAGPARVQAMLDEAWVRRQPAVRRYLAAKAFASWLALQGEGIRTTVLGIRIALGVLRAEAARGVAARVAAPGSSPTREASPRAEEELKQAVRRADLLLVHLVDPLLLARELSRCEVAGGRA